jgi:hypothetical protein
MLRAREHALRRHSNDAGPRQVVALYDDPGADYYTRRDPERAPP